MTSAQSQVHAMIRVIGRHWLLSQVLWYGITALAALLAWVLVMVVADNVLILSPTGLIFGWLLLGIGYAAWMSCLAYRLTLGRPGPTSLALLYESRMPGLHNRLVNAVSFLFTGQAERDPMARAALLENAQGLDPKTAPQAIDYRPVRTVLMVLSTCLVLLLAYTALRPAMVGNGLRRVLNPFNPVPHELATDIRVTPGNKEIIEGQALPIAANISRNLPSEVLIEYRVGDLGWTRATMLAAATSGANSGGGSYSGGGGASYRYDQFKAVWQALDYRVCAGRSTSPTYHVTVQARPRVQSIQASYTLPDYTGGETRELKPDVGDVSALVGSTVHLKFRANMPLSAGQLEFANGTRTDLLISGDTAAASFPLTQSGSYAVRLTDTAKPTALSNVNPPRYTLTAVEDQPPSADVARPGRDLILPLNGVVELTIEAYDDWGLASVALQVRSGGGGGSGGREWQEIQRWDYPELNARHRTINPPINLPRFHLKVNDVLLYRVVAADHHQPQPNPFVGRTWSITAGNAADDHALLAAEAKRLLDELNAILVLQKENRTDTDMDRAIDSIRAKQSKVRQMTMDVIDGQRKALRPSQTMLDELVNLADGPMVKANDLLGRYQGSVAQRQPLKAPILAVMDQIIAKLEELVGKVGRALALADKSAQSMDKLSAPDREQALQTIRDMLDKLRKFEAAQDKVISDTEELVRKADNLAGADLKKIEQLKGTEDKWADTFAASVKDINKLTEQGFADQTMVSEFKQMVEAIEEAAKDLNPKITTMVVKREDVGREMAQKLAEDMEMWLPNTPDNTKWVLEEPLDKPEIPMAKLPDNLSDLIGDLIKQEDEMTQEADDQTSAWADSISAAGWGVSDGPISNFSAVGKTGNQLPNNNELSGRAGDGRSGKSQGQMVGDEARGLEGRKTPTRVTNDTYEKGVVKELQQMATGGATGGGKARGTGQEGLQGASAPPTFDKMEFMKDWQQRIRQQAEKVAGQLKSVHINTPDLDKAIEAMKKVEQHAKDGRYTEMYKTQQMVLQQLRSAAGLTARDTAIKVDRAYNLPAEQRRPVLDDGDEPVPQEYHDAVRRYFENLSKE